MTDNLEGLVADLEYQIDALMAMKAQLKLADHAETKSWASLRVQDRQVAIGELVQKNALTILDALKAASEKEG